MKDDGIGVIVVFIVIVLIVVAMLSSGGNEKQTTTDSRPVTTTEPVPEQSSQQEPEAEQAEQLIEQAQDALVELKKETGVKKNSSELRDVYKKLGEICNKAVQTQKNMLDAEYKTPDAENTFNTNEVMLSSKNDTTPVDSK